MGDVNIVARTQKIVVSTQQRIVVEEGSVRVLSPTKGIRILSAGPQGPAGVIPPAPPTTARGTINTNLIVWIMSHGLDQPEEELNPTLWWFKDQDGNPMEPVKINYVNNDTATAEWDEPVRGSWLVG